MLSCSEITDTRCLPSHINAWHEDSIEVKSSGLSQNIEYHSMSLHACATAICFAYIPRRQTVGVAWPDAGATKTACGGYRCRMCRLKITCDACRAGGGAPRASLHRAISTTATAVHTAQSAMHKSKRAGSAQRLPFTFVLACRFVVPFLRCTHSTRILFSRYSPCT